MSPYDIRDLRQNAIEPSQETVCLLTSRVNGSITVDSSNDYLQGRSSSILRAFCSIVVRFRGAIGSSNARDRLELDTGPAPRSRRLIANCPAVGVRCATAGAGITERRNELIGAGGVAPMIVSRAAGTRDLRGRRLMVRKMSATVPVTANFIRSKVPHARRTRTSTVSASPMGSAGGSISSKS